MPVYEFGCFRVDLTDRCVFRKGQLVTFPPKPFDVLALLIESNGQLVSKEELMQRIWEDSPVEESNLTVSVAKIRKLLAEGKHQRQRYIVTLPRRGYRFVATVRKVQEHLDSIAVLPFDNKNTDPEIVYLANGLTESLIYNLSRLSNLTVSPGSSVLRYKGKDMAPQRIALELGVNAVVLGRVFRYCRNLTITAELIDARRNVLLWGDCFQGNIADLLINQSEIAREISGNLRLHLATPKVETM